MDYRHVSGHMWSRRPSSVCVCVCCHNIECHFLSGVLEMNIFSAFIYYMHVHYMESYGKKYVVPPSKTVLQLFSHRPGFDSFKNIYCFPHFSMKLVGSV